MQSLNQGLNVQLSIPCTHMQQTLKQIVYVVYCNDSLHVAGKAAEGELGILMLSFSS